MLQPQTQRTKNEIDTYFIDLLHRDTSTIYTCEVLENIDEPERTRYFVHISQKYSSNDVTTLFQGVYELVLRFQHEYLKLKKVIQSIDTSTAKVIFEIRNPMQFTKSMTAHRFAEATS